MFLKNNKARLVTINGKYANGVRVERFQIKPGNNPAVDVPDRLCNTPYVKALIKDGTLSVIDGAGAQSEPTQYDDMAKADLVALCEARDIEVVAKDTKAVLIGKLVAADEAAE